MPLASCAFQNIISLETIEHIADDRGFLRELTRVLRPDGVCILSTPNRAYSEKQGITNPYHVREYHEDELLQLLSIYFGSVELFHQGFVREYHDQVRDYANAIQEQKKQLNPLVQWGIHKLYRPIKRYIPVAATSYFIHKLLRLSYPQPKPTAITISEGMVEGCNVFIAVCQEPP